MGTHITGFALVLIAMSGLAVLMGRWLANTFEDQGHWRLERISYRVLGINPEERMGWARYGLALLLSNAAMMALAYLLLRLQGHLPWNALGTGLSLMYSWLLRICTRSPGRPIRRLM